MNPFVKEKYFKLLQSIVGVIVFLNGEEPLFIESHEYKAVSTRNFFTLFHFNVCKLILYTKTVMKQLP